MTVMRFCELATSGGIASGVVWGGLVWDHFNRFAFVFLGALYLLVSLFMALAPVIDRVAGHGQIRIVAARYLRVVPPPPLFFFFSSLVFLYTFVCGCVLVLFTVMFF